MLHTPHRSASRRFPGTPHGGESHETQAAVGGANDRCRPETIRQGNCSRRVFREVWALLLEPVPGRLPGSGRLGKRLVEFARAAALNGRATFHFRIRIETLCLSLLVRGRAGMEPARAPHVPTSHSHPRHNEPSEYDGPSHECISRFWGGGSQCLSAGALPSLASFSSPTRLRRRNGTPSKGGTLPSCVRRGKAQIAPLLALLARSASGVAS